MTTLPATHAPRKRTPKFKLLLCLLSGKMVDPLYALVELNIVVLPARVCELRRMGWPVQKKTAPHYKIPNARVPVYYMDEHFRRWVAANPDKHPRLYPGQEGRGPYTTD